MKPALWPRPLAARRLGRGVSFAILALVFCLVGRSPALAGSEAAAHSAAVLYMFYEAGCPYCERWEEDIGEGYDRTPEARIAPLKRLPIHRASHLFPNIAPVHYSPTFVLMVEQREIGRILGYPGEDFFWWQLDRLVGRLGTQVQRDRRTRQ